MNHTEDALSAHIIPTITCTIIQIVLQLQPENQNSCRFSSNKWQIYSCKLWCVHTRIVGHRPTLLRKLKQCQLLSANVGRCTATVVYEQTFKCIHNLTQTWWDRYYYTKQENPKGCTILHEHLNEPSKFVLTIHWTYGQCDCQLNVR